MRYKNLISGFALNTLVLHVVASLAVLNGGYMIFDAIHRFTTGDFLRIEGQLGPWANIATFIGVDPLDLGPFFLVFGISQIVCAFGLIRRTRWGYRGTRYLAVASLFYFMVGTVIALIQIILLRFVPRGHSEMNS